MKAFTIGSSSDSSYVTQWHCQHYLPQVECDLCGETSWDEGVWYPWFSINPKSDKSRFSNKITVSVTELNSLRKLVTGAGRKDARLLPAAGIGPVHAKLPKRGTDFLWCGSKPLLSQRAADVLAKDGIVFTTGPVIPPRTGKQAGYVALQIPSVPLYSRHTLEQLTLVRCEKCDCWHLKNLRVNLNGSREYVSHVIPAGHTLIKVEEGGETIATQQFIDAVVKHKLTGIKFRERGVFV